MREYRILFQPFHETPELGYIECELDASKACVDRPTEPLHEANIRYFYFRRVYTRCVAFG